MLATFGNFFVKEWLSLEQHISLHYEVAITELNEVRTSSHASLQIPNHIGDGIPEIAENSDLCTLKCTYNCNRYK